MSSYSGTIPELYYSEAIAGNTLASFTSEASVMGNYPIPQVPATFFNKTGNLSSSMKIKAQLNITSATTPTFTVSARLLSSSTSWSAGGVLLGSSNAITAGSSVTLAWASVDMDVTLSSIAAGAATSSLTSIGSVAGSAFPSPGSIPANNTTATNSTFDATGATQYFLWLSVACSASNASNKAQLQALKVYLEN